MLWMRSARERCRVASAGGELYCNHIYSRSVVYTYSYLAFCIEQSDCDNLFSYGWIKYSESHCFVGIQENRRRLWFWEIKNNMWGGSWNKLPLINIKLFLLKTDIVWIIPPCKQRWIWVLHWHIQDIPRTTYLFPELILGQAVRDIDTAQQAASRVVFGKPGLCSDDKQTAVNTFTQRNLDKRSQ